MNMAGDIGELRFTIEVKRAATGETDIVELVGAIDPKDLEKLKEADNGCDSLDSGS